MKKLIVGNWKMKPLTYDEAERLVDKISAFPNKDGAKIVLCPPFVWLTDLSHEAPSGIEFGAQDVFWENPKKGGAFTGEISAAMLKNSNVKYVILGHSERRNILGETDEIINKKITIVIHSGLNPILCIGEPKNVSRKGFEAVASFLTKQIGSDLMGVKNSGLRKLVIAYEPYWAIGSGVPQDTKDASDIAEFIKKFINQKYKIKNIPVLYGGSVNSSNAKDYLSLRNINGLLVGGASVDASEFLKILRAV